MVVLGWGVVSHERGTPVAGVWLSSRPVFESNTWGLSDISCENPSDFLLAPEYLSEIFGGMGSNPLQCSRLARAVHHRHLRVSSDLKVDAAGFRVQGGGLMG